ncbi:MAG: lysylphosphatidylglycerol synthase transmembrane domain-containing protein [Actinomycetes bacterium]
MSDTSPPIGPEVVRVSPKPGPPTTDRRAVSGASTLVIEGDVIPRRLRRPADLLRFVFAIALALLVLAGAFFASSTASGIDRDITAASSNIPHLLVVLVNIIGYAGVLVLPAGAAVDLLLRGRGRQLLESIAVLALTVLLVFALALWIQHAESAQLLTALTGRPTATGVAPLKADLSGVVAFITVARLIDRTRWAMASIALVVAICIASVVSGGITVAALGLSILIGWAVGLLARYALGTPTTRPSGLKVAAALERSGFALTVLRASHETAAGRRYSATSRVGERMEVLVLDRDLEGAGLAQGIWRSLRLRDHAGTGGFTMRSRLDHAALQSYAAQAAGAPVPRLEAVAEVGPDAALLAYARIDGLTFAEIGSDLTDSDLDGAWRAIRAMHDADISHRTLHADNLLRDANGEVWLLDPEEGSVAAGDIAERLDLAELLCTLAMLTDPDRAIAAGRRVLGTERLVKALPALQPVALTAVTRRAIRRHKVVLITLRESLEELTPEGPGEQLQFERLKPRMVLTAIAGTLAGYLLLIQLGEVNLITLFSQANWWLAALAIIFSGLTYVGATMSVEGFIPERLKFLRTMQAQLASSFAILVSPPTLGSVGVNIRYLQKTGVHPALAAASIGVSQVFAFIMHILLVLGFGVLAGTQSNLEFSPPRWAVVIAVAFVVTFVLIFLLPFTRHWAQQRVRPIAAQIGPRLLTLAQRPLQLAKGIAGFLLLNLAYCFCLLACVRAFGGGGEWAAICVAYLVGATVGQVAPTPGGLGAVEAALTGALGLAGVEGGVALSAVLMFRAFTFWLPTIPGWFCFNDMVKKGYL